MSSNYLFDKFQYVCSSVFLLYKWNKNWLFVKWRRLHYLNKMPGRITVEIDTPRQLLSTDANVSALSFWLTILATCTCLHFKAKTDCNTSCSVHPQKLQDRNTARKIYTQRFFSTLTNLVAFVLLLWIAMV